MSFEAGKSELAGDRLPHEQQYKLAIHSVLQDMGYSTFAPEASETGKGKPDIAVKIGAETFIIELAKSKIPQHLERFQVLEDYKIASHKGLYIIGNDSKKILSTMTKHKGGDVQIIGLVPNIAHTAYTVYVKSKGIKSINTFTVDCDLVARRLMLKDDGKPELYTVQSLKSVNLSQKPESRRWARSLVVRMLARRTIVGMCWMPMVVSLREVVRGWESRLFLAGSVSASLLSVHACRSFDPLDSQDGQVTPKLRLKEDSDAFISCPC